MNRPPGSRPASTSRSWHPTPWRPGDRARAIVSASCATTHLTGAARLHPCRPRRVLLDDRARWSASSVCAVLLLELPGRRGRRGRRVVERHAHEPGRGDARWASVSPSAVAHRCVERTGRRPRTAGARHDDQEQQHSRDDQHEQPDERRDPAQTAGRSERSCSGRAGAYRPDGVGGGSVDGGLARGAVSGRRGSVRAQPTSSVADGPRRERPAGVPSGRSRRAPRARPGATDMGDGMRPDRRAMATSAAEPPLNARCPVSISYSTSPVE